MVDWPPHPLLQVSIDLWKTITPHSSFIYSTMHIYPWQNYSPTPSIEHRCLEYHYIKLGRSTSRSAPLNWALMSWIPLHQTWHIYWQIYPQSIEHRSLEYHYTKLGRSTGRSTPQSIEHRCLEYHYTKLSRSTPENFYIWKTFYLWG